MSIQQQVILRYRSSGHVRFDLPAMLCGTETGGRLISGMRGVEGVYRVDLYRRQRKLSLRYTEGVTDFRQLAAALVALVAEIESNPAPSYSGGGTDIAFRRNAGASSGIATWLKAKYREARETVTAMGIVSRSAVRKSAGLSANQKKFVAEFLTDVLVLYLIKTHWHLITQHWLKRPWQYRYEWMAALYMIFLLVSSKKPKH
ncbi:MAG: cation transporter [Proteobacteria bacterium]|nr:cation transporter [Pseudomonadota bacterium]